jgi:hypothetical protein
VRRTAFFVGLIFVALTTSLSAEPASIKRSSPEVWDWRPASQPKEFASVNFWNWGDNDILISYSNSNYPQIKSETIVFFSGRKFRSPEEAFGVAPGAIHPDPIIDRSAKLPNGKIVSPNTGSHCSQGIGAQIRVYDNQNSLLITRTLILLLDKPWRSPDVICEETKVRGFSRRYIVFQPSQTIPLSDNTFLVSDVTTGTVIRFDENLNTKSSLLGKYLFMIDPTVLENRIKTPRHRTSSDKFFEQLCLEISTGKNMKTDTK